VKEGLMPSPQEPAPKGSPRAVFGSVLRFFRERAGLSQEQLAELAHMSLSTIGSYETARRVPPRDAVAGLEAVTELNAHGLLLKLWDEFEDGMTYRGYPEWFEDWPDLEAAATTLRWFEPLLVPGLLQTEAYARALFAAEFGLTAEEIDTRVAARLKRQEILARNHPPALWVILDEGVVRRPVGGRHVMAEQVSRMIEATRRPSVRLHVIPVSVGAYTGLAGHFVIADLPNAPSAAYREGAREGLVIREPKQVAELVLAWDTLRSEALSRGDSLALLEEAAKAWTSAA
jgi:transcriptional regulator with XRE-family HTH domain